MIWLLILVLVSQVVLFIRIGSIGPAIGELLAMARVTQSMALSTWQKVRGDQ